MATQTTPIAVTVVEKRIRRSNYRYLGFVVVRDEAGREWELPMTGSVAQWLTEGETLELELLDEGGSEGRPGFEGYALRKGRLEIWPLYAKRFVQERRSPLTDRPLYRYRVRAREARYERDYEAIVELEQYHYASDEEILADWHCENCDIYEEANAKPRCPRCGAEMRFHDLKSATRASRFLVLELLDREPYEPHYVGYVRVDPPVPLMNRRLPDGSVERRIRERVFPKGWFAHPFHPEALGAEATDTKKPKDWWQLQEEALKRARSPVSRLARAVVHPDYRVDGLGQLAVRALLDWVRRRAVPEMRVAKQAVETIALMARYNPFLEKAGFVYLWDTGSGRPVLYYPLTKRARAHIERFLEGDPVAKEHGGRLYRPRFAPVERLDSPIVLKDFTKAYTNTLTLENLSEPVRRMLEAFGVRQRVIQKFVLRHATIEVPPGGVVAVLGASGAGKTTLLRVLYGLLAGLDDPMYRPDEGEARLPTNARVQIYLPGEHEPDFGDQPIAEALFRVTGDEALAVEILNYAGISDAVLYRAPFRELSTGQKERAKLAYLLAHRPNVVLIDEFAAHLDPTTAVRVARRMSQLAREKALTLVLVTHRREVLDALEPDEVYLVGYGTLLREKELPERAFRVWEPYATYIVEGKKRWEIRRYPTSVRGRVGILSGDKLIGTVEIHGSKGPFTPEELREHQDKHLADEQLLKEYARGRKLWAWELRDARKFEEPVDVVPKRGQRTWVKLDEAGEAQQPRPRRSSSPSSQGGGGRGG